MRRLRLREHRTEYGVELSVAERDRLRVLVPSLSVAPSVGRQGFYDLRPGSYVGAVNLSDLSVAILPKIPVSRALFLVSYALDPDSWAKTGFDFDEEGSLIEAVMPGFVRQVRLTLRRGPLESYRTEEATLTTVRGRLRLGDQMRRRYGAWPPVEVTHDEFTEDIEENRLIKAALHRLARMRIRSAAARRSLGLFDSALERVRLVDYDPRRLPEIRYTRLNGHYRPAVELAKLVLRSASFEVRHGRVRASSFLMDMNAVFEDFVVVALREALRVTERAFPQGNRGRSLYLDEGRRVSLEPDISWWEGGCTFVGDAKYKEAPPGGVNADLYQLLSYVVAAGLPGGLLVYGAGGASAVHQVGLLGKSLEVESLDLTEPPEGILRQVGELAARIRSLRAQYLAAATAVSG
jgi:5-methylcytosine-specific restriction enzyme subunit McrC